jgi:Replication-relaxation
MAGNSRKLVILQNRDVHLLREVAVMRVIDREQAKIVAGFRSTTRANARLLALTQAGFLRRFFWGSVGGARKSLYALSVRGAQIVGLPDRGPRRGQDQVLAADYFSLHQLQVNELYCTLKYQRLLGVKFLRWVSFHKAIEGTTLIPDGYAEVEAKGTVLASFLEADLGTENRAAWQRKVQAYLSYASSGNFARQFGHPQFRTLVVTTSDSRLTSLRNTTAQSTDKIFRFVTAERIRRESFWSTIWQRPAGDAREALF